MFVGKAKKEPSLEQSTRKVLRWIRLLPYLQALDQVGTAYQGQTLYLLTKIRKVWPKKFYNIGPWSNISLQGREFTIICKYSTSQGQTL